MKNTGYQQAVMAKKVSYPGNFPLDVDGDLCSDSGKKQAILLLEGEDNPSPGSYEVEGTFKYGDIIEGYDTRVYNPEACPIEVKLPDYEKYPVEERFVEVYPTIYDVERDRNTTPGALGFAPFLGKDWDTGLPAEGTGNDAESNTTYTGGWNRGTYKVRRVGEYEWTLENFKAVYSRTGSLGAYALNQSQLDNAGIPMTLEESNIKNGLFAFAANATNGYFNRTEVYSDKYYTQGSINPNLFGEASIVHWNTNRTGAGPFDFTLYEDPNATAIIIPQRMLRTNESGSNQLRSITISRESNNGDLILVRSYDLITGLGTYHGSAPVVSDTSLTVPVPGTATPPYWIVIVDTKGTPFDQLPKIKIEFGNVATEWIPHKDTYKIDGWRIPKQEDFLQLFGMVGEDFSITNMRKHLCVSPDDSELSWLSEFPQSGECKDILGVRFLPTGYKNNGTTPEIPNNDGELYGFGKRFGFLTYDERESGSSASPSLWMDTESATYLMGNVNWDIANVTTPNPGSCQYWQRSVRFCRPLTDDELGYKLWSDEPNDQIIVTSSSALPPAGVTELPKGLLRGMAVRWFDDRDNPTEVLASLSYLLEEVEKTKNNGGYQWIGFGE